MPTFNITTIEALPLPTKGNKFHGFAGALVQGKPIPRGLGVVVTANGVRSFVLNYLIGGRERRYALGRVGEFNVPQAIERARELRQQIERGDDPLAARQAARAPIVAEKTVAQLFEDWRQNRTEASISQVSAFRKHILPAIGNRSFKALDKPTLADLKRTIRKDGGDVIADRALTYLGTVLRWQARENETDWVAPALPGKVSDDAAHEREHTLSDVEIRALWPVWEQSGVAGQICRLLLLTACRRSEIADLTWAEIAADGRTVTLPATRYKTRRSHSFPLSTPAAAILTGISEAGRRPDGRVFPTLSFDRTKAQLDAKLKLEPAWHFHDLRRTAASIMYSAGISDVDCDEVLGHVRRKITRVYLRDRNRGGDFMDRKRRAVDVLAREIERIISPPADNVTVLRTGA